MNRYVRFSALLQIHEEIQHLRLDRHVERGDRFVADQELGLHRERARDADARSLAAGELVRIAAHQRRIEADAIEHRRDVIALLARADQPMRDRRLAHDVDHAHARIERRVGILEDHLHLELLPARVGCGEARERLPAPIALAGGQREQSGGEAAERRLAAPRFADQPHDFAGKDREVDVVDRMHDLLVHVRAEAIADLARRGRAT